MGDHEFKKNIIVDLYDLKLSTRSFHRLKSTGITTLNDLIDSNASSIKGLSKANIQEIAGIIAQADEIFNHFAQRQAKIDEIYKELSQVSLRDLPLGGRAIKALRMVNISTAGDLLHMSKREVMELDGLGPKTRNEILGVIDGLVAKGSGYLKTIELPEKSIVADSEVGHDNDATKAKGFDYPLIDRLRQEFSWKTVILAAQFGCSRQSISEMLKRRPKKRYAKWTGKRMSQQEEELLRGLITSKKSKYCDEKVSCYWLNNRRDNFVCLFFYADNIKCFFLEDLPSLLQTKVIESNLTRMTEEEFDIASSGTVVSILKQKSFVPAPADKNRFLRLAASRGMNINEYSLLLTGLPLASPNQITDERIVQFLESHLVNGEVFISSEPSNSWIRKFANKNGYSIDELIEFYGYKSARNISGNDYSSQRDESAWSNEEDEILYQYFTIEGLHVVHRLPDKDLLMCLNRAKELGIVFHGSSWTVDEDNVIRQFYPIEGASVSNRLPKRTPTACELRARKLGIKYTETASNHKSWTDEEEEIVRRYYPTLRKAITEMLPGRTADAINLKFYRLVKEDASQKKNDSKSVALKLRNVAAWSKEEDAIICEYYPVEGRKTVYRLPGKTAGMLSYRAKKLGVSFQARARWTQEEDDILRQFYPLEGDTVYKRLPGRTQQICWGRARQLGIRFINTHKNLRAWTEAEDDIIRHNYPSKGNLISELLPGRSVCAIRQRVVKIMNQKSEPTSNIPKPARPRKPRKSGWSNEEDNILREYYPIEGMRVVNRLPNRTASACIHRVSKLGVLCQNCMRWTDEENNIIRYFFPLEGGEVCNRLPGRNRQKCLAHAHQLGIKFNGPRIKHATWTDDEEDILYNYYPAEGSRVAIRLPRHTAQARTARAVKLGISCRSRMRWSEEEDAIVLQDYPVRGAAIAELLPGRTASAILQRFNKLTRTERLRAKDTSDSDDAEPSDKAD